MTPKRGTTKSRIGDEGDQWAVWGTLDAVSAPHANPQVAVFLSEPLYCRGTGAARAKSTPIHGYEGGSAIGPSACAHGQLPTIVRHHDARSQSDHLACASTFQLSRVDGVCCWTVTTIVAAWSSQSEQLQHHSDASETKTHIVWEGLPDRLSTPRRHRGWRHSLHQIRNLDDQILLSPVRHSALCWSIAARTTGLSPPNNRAAHARDCHFRSMMFNFGTSPWLPAVTSR